MQKQEDINTVLIIFILFIITILLLVKVYISNKIYIISRDIQKVSSKIDALKEEQNILHLKVEKLKYKNAIADPLFNYKVKKDENQEYKNEENN